LDIYLRLSSSHALRPAITIDDTSAFAADDSRALFYGMLLAAFGLLLLYNLVRFAYTRIRSSLWLALAQLSLLGTTSTLLGINASWLVGWPGLQVQAGNISILLAILCSLAFTLNFF
ncbi:7TM diverse intracellular signaling domain-containing protein, partial [Pseudomonas viridiflava]|uniref:7TM diverse intracellular signaling domain-containing protein n=1 Tax=Pseudomonas viridiflava TaxID=33069 RepID=UPI0023F840ED